MVGALVSYVSASRILLNIILLIDLYWSIIMTVAHSKWLIPSLMWFSKVLVKLVVKYKSIKRTMVKDLEMDVDDKVF